jgi:hypothetical protein
MATEAPYPSNDRFNDILSNSGTIAILLGNTGTAVAFANGNDLLVDDPGAVFIGTVFGGARENMLELAPEREPSPASAHSASSSGLSPSTPAAPGSRKAKRRAWLPARRSAALQPAIRSFSVAQSKPPSAMSAMPGWS